MRKQIGNLVVVVISSFYLLVLLYRSSSIPSLTDAYATRFELVNACILFNAIDIKVQFESSVEWTSWRAESELIKRQIAEINKVWESSSFSDRQRATRNKGYKNWLEMVDDFRSKWGAKWPLA